MQICHIFINVGYFHAVMGVIPDPVKCRQYENVDVLNNITAIHVPHISS